jgi:excisionase family DNA binding protein
MTDLKQAQRVPAADQLAFDSQSEATVVLPTTRRRPAAAKSPASTSPGLLDIAGAAERLGTPQRFVRRLVDQRRIAFYKVGKYVRFDPADIDRWLAAQRVEARDTPGVQ